MVGVDAVARDQIAPVEWLLSEDGQSIYVLMPNPDTRSIRRGHPAEINRYYGRISADRSVPFSELQSTVAALHRAANAYPKLVVALKDLIEEDRALAANLTQPYADEGQALLRELGELK